ncbi:MAG: vWA domain-containing protein, partial [Candidatus Binatia bacterium]
MERILRSSAAMGAARWSRADWIVIVMMSLQLVACGGGGGGGGGGSSSGGDAGDITVGQTATFLSREPNALPNADPRTSHRVEVTLSGLTNPLDQLPETAIEVRLDGKLDVEGHVAFGGDGTVKRNLTLIIDVSGSLTAADLQEVKRSAEDFVTKILPVTGRLRIYTFASQSEINLVDQYVSTQGTTGPTWVPSPVADIQAIQRGSDSTALFEAVRRAIVEQPVGPRDVLAVFSDGRENSSPKGAREVALSLIEDEEIRVHSVGFGSVDADDLRRLSAYGKFFGVRPSLVGLFDDVAREVLSTYTVVYDTPAAFGMLTLDVRIEAEKRRYRFETSLLAGIDLARAAIVRYPTVPGSSVELRDLRTTPPTTTTYEVASLEHAVRRTKDGLLAFAVDECTGTLCKRHYQGIFGSGAQSESEDVYVPAVLDEGATWTDAVAHEKLTFVGFEDLVVLRGTAEQRRYRCAVVDFPGGRHWLAPEVGLVRTDDS